MFLLHSIILKHLLGRIALKILSSIAIFSKLKLPVFFQHLMGEISCFLPFFVIPCFINLFHFGSSNFDGIANDSGHVLTFFILSGSIILGFCLKIMQRDNMSTRKIIKTQKKLCISKKDILKKKKPKMLYNILCFL